VGVTAADHGRFMDAVLYRYRTGMPWRDLPQRLGNFRVLHTEIAKARRWEVRDKARVLFPISLAPFEVIRDWEAFDADIGKDSAREIREHFIPDFSHRKDHDSYQKAFDRLVRDLQVPRQAPAHTRQ
jgi:hypothetical protein